MTHWRRVLYKLEVLALATALTGCLAHVQPLPKADSTVPSFPPLSQDGETLVGIALSGGGSRAAFFGAAGSKRWPTSVSNPDNLRSSSR